MLSRAASSRVATMAAATALVLGTVTFAAGDDDPRPQYGSVPLDELRVGDCVDNLGNHSQVVTLNRVSCATRHTSQVFAIVGLHTTTYSDQALSRQSLDACGQQLRATIPFALNDKSTELTWLQPLEHGWSKDDRSATCILTTHEAHTGSNIAHYSQMQQ